MNKLPVLKLLARRCAVLIMTFVMGLGATSATAGIEVSTFTLKNGLQVVVIPDHRAPIVTHMVWYKIGGADDPYGAAGTAHFLEHLMFKRTKNLKEGEFSRIVTDNGGQFNAFTDYDFTAYFENVSADRLPLMMKIEADRMANLDLNPADIASERKVIIEERRMRIDNVPSALLDEQMSALQFLAHPYGTPLIGWLNEMRKLSYQDVETYYKTYYTPSNAILIVAGDVTPDEVKTLAKKYYGVIPSHPVPERVRVEEPKPLAARRVVMADPRVTQPSWRRSYLAPSYHRGDSQYAVPLEVLAQILGGGNTSRLYQKLVVEKTLAVDAGAAYNGTAYDLGTFYLYATPVAGQDPEKARLASMAVEQAVDEVIADLLKNGVKPDELTRAKNELIASSTYARDNISNIAQLFGQALTTGQTVQDVVDWPNRVAAVTADQVMAAAKYVLRPERSVTGLLLPKALPPGSVAPSVMPSGPSSPPHPGGPTSLMPTSPIGTSLTGVR